MTIDERHAYLYSSIFILPSGQVREFGEFGVEDLLGGHKLRRLVRCRPITRSDVFFDLGETGKGLFHIC